MEHEYHHIDAAGDAALSAVRIQSAFINRVFGWMTAGLAVTGMTAWYLAAYHAPAIIRMGRGMLFIVLLEMAVVIGLTAAIRRISPLTALLGFLLYAALNGVTFSVIFLAYEFDSIAATFFATSGTFGAMGLFGWLTKRDLTSVGNLCFMGLVGIIIASIVNIFFRNGLAATVISWLGVLIFVGLTAYDAQKIKQLSIAAGDGAFNEDDSRKYAIIGALTLYLDFINLFLYLLRLFGRRR